MLLLYSSSRMKDRSHSNDHDESGAWPLHCNGGKVSAAAASLRAPLWPLPFC